MSRQGRRNQRDDTFAALTREKAKRGRPRSVVPRQSVYVALSKLQKQRISQMAKQLPPDIKRADVPDMCVMTLQTRIEQIRRAVAGRDRELPEGITDMESLYFLWDLPLPPKHPEVTWTSMRLSPQQVLEFGRLQGTFNALFGANRSDVFTLALMLLDQVVEKGNSAEAFPYTTLDEYSSYLSATYL
ncbi:MAG: hypothetical protein ACPG8W_07695 [Candidatus Promineifilaceae bacterium]